MSHIDRELKFQPINFCGCFNLRQTLAFSKLCDLIVGCDSGNLHIAASVDIPVIGIYGPMNTIKWAPHCSVAKIIKTICSFNFNFFIIKYIAYIAIPTILNTICKIFLSAESGAKLLLVK